MDQPEIILNLWYLVDEMGIIYSLRARAYMGIGSDSEKLAFLKKLSEIDYLIARPFPIPKRFHISGVGGLAVYHKVGYDLLENKVSLFEDAIKQLQSELPSQTPFDIPLQPLVCITALIGEENGNIVPIIT